MSADEDATSDVEADDTDLDDDGTDAGSDERDIGGDGMGLEGDESDFDDLEPGNEFASMDGESDFGTLDDEFDRAGEDTGDGAGEFDGMAEDFDDELEFDEPSGDEGGEIMSDDAGTGGDEAGGSASGGPDRATVVGLAGEQLADVLSQAWVNRGWETDVAEDDGSFYVTGDRGDGRRGLILVLPGDVEVPGKRLQQYATLAEKKSVDVRVVATQGTFTDDAERIAKANDVHLLDPQAILETVEAEGLEDELSRFASENGGSGGGGGGGGGGIGAAISGLPVPSVGLPGGAALPSPGGKGLKSVLVIVLIATSLLAGFAGGAFLGPGTGGGGGAVAAAIGGLAGGGDDVAVASLSTAEPGSAGLTVGWNARTAHSVVANGSSYEAPDGSRFLVVQLVVRNTGDDRVAVKAGDFLVNANGTRYAHQPLDGVRTFEMAAVSPGNETIGWVVFAIPEDVTDAVLVPDMNAAGGPVTFVRDPTLAINGTG